MTFQFAYLVVLALVLGTVLWTTSWIHRHRDGREADAFVVCLLLTAYWVGGFGVQVAVPTATMKLVVFHLWVPMAWLVPLAFAVFTVYYTGRGHWLSRPVWGAIGLWAAFVTGLSLTNPWHRRLWTDFELRTEPFPVLDAVRTPLHDGLLIVSYGLVVVGLLLLAVLFFHARRASSRQAAWLLVGMGLVLTAHSTFMTRVGGAIELNPTPATAGVFSLVVAWALFRHRLFAVQPFARDVILSAIDDGVVVIDGNGKVSDFNRRAVTFLPALPDAVGAPLRTHCPGLLADPTQPLSTRLDASSKGDPVPGPVDGAFVEQFETDEPDTRIVDVETSPIESAGTVRGYVLLLRDVTENRRLLDQLAERNDRLERKNRQLERLASVIAHDLRTPVSTAEKVSTLLRMDLEEPSPTVEESLETLDAVHRRLFEFVETLPRLARESTDVDQPVDCDLQTVSQAAWEVVDTGALDLEYDGNCTLRGDPRRLQQLFENLFRNVVDHAVDPADAPAANATAVADVDGGTGAEVGIGVDDGTGVDDGVEAEDDAGVDDGAEADDGTEVDDGTGTIDDGSRRSEHDTRSATTVRVGSFADGVFLEDDGPGVDPRLDEAVFEYGTSTDGGSGFGLAIVRTIVEAHGWEVAVANSAAGGARFEIYTRR